MSWKSDDTKIKISQAVVAMFSIAGGSVIVDGMREVGRALIEVQEFDRIPLICRCHLR